MKGYILDKHDDVFVEKVDKQVSILYNAGFRPSAVWVYQPMTEQGAKIGYISTVCGALPVYASHSVPLDSVFVVDEKVLIDNISLLKREDNKANEFFDRLNREIDKQAKALYEAGFQPSAVWVNQETFEQVRSRAEGNSDNRFIDNRFVITAYYGTVHFYTNYGMLRICTLPSLQSPNVLVVDEKFLRDNIALLEV